MTKMREEQIAELERALEEKGYEKFNFRFIGVALSFKEGLSDYLEKLESGTYPEPDLPITAIYNFGASTVGDPVAIGTFYIDNQPEGKIQLTSMHIKLYDCIDSPQPSATIKIEPLNDIPNRQQAKKQINDARQKRGLRVRKQYRRFKM